MTRRDDKPTNDEVLECLNRSGYLLESRLAQQLFEHDFFVESNQVVRDVRTGKSREIDLIAEHERYTPEHKYSHVRTTFVVEASNNKYPFVLLTPWRWTPMYGPEVQNKFIITPPSQESRIWSHLDPEDERRESADEAYTQFCVLTRKSGAGELMASHTDDIYGSLLKVAEYIEQNLTDWRNDRGEHFERYWRIFFWQPVLVLSGNLLVVRLQTDGTPFLEETQSARLVFNWHAGDQPTTTIFNVVTESYFKQFVSSIEADDFQMEKKLHALRLETLGVDLEDPQTKKEGPKAP